MDKLQTLCDRANGKRQRFFNVSPRAAELFKRWLSDWQSAATPQEVLDRWEMGSLDEHLKVRPRWEGKRVQVELVSPHAPWEPGGASGVNGELLYLVLTLVTTPGCERLRLCPECGKCFVAPRLSQKYCSSLCGRRVAMRRIAEKKYKGKRNQKLQAARVFIRQWKSTRQWPDWKKFVCHKRREITRNFLTHAVNKGELVPPKGEK